jgi:ABC-type sulfate transport system permease component
MTWQQADFVAAAIEIATMVIIVSGTTSIVLRSVAGWRRRSQRPH